MPIPNIDRNQINNEAASRAKALVYAFERIAEYKAWLDTQTDANLIAQYGYVQADLDVLRSAYADLSQLKTIHEGLTNLAVAKDFRSFVKLLYAFGSF